MHSGDHADKQEYLRKAFIGFFRAKKEVEMQHLGRVICAILCLSVEEQDQVMRGIGLMTPSINLNSTIESLTSNFAGMFG